jgi:hypothetical protein
MATESRYIHEIFALKACCLVRYLKKILASSGILALQAAITAMGAKSVLPDVSYSADCLQSRNTDEATVGPNADAVATCRLSRR